MICDACRERGVALRAMLSALVDVLSTLHLLLVLTDKRTLLEENVRSLEMAMKAAHELLEAEVTE